MTPVQPLWGAYIKRGDWVGVLPQPPFQLFADYVIQVHVTEQIVSVLYFRASDLQMEAPDVDSLIVRP